MNVDAYKKEVKDMGIGLMPGRDEQWTLALRSQPCSRKDGKCGCYDARDMADDMRELDEYNSPNRSAYLVPTELTVISSAIASSRNQRASSVALSTTPV
jgi:hypothetical protein